VSKSLSRSVFFYCRLLHVSISFWKHLNNHSSIGKMNYFLGRGAVEDGRGECTVNTLDSVSMHPFVSLSNRLCAQDLSFCVTGSPYGDVDLCEDPEQICSSSKHKELKWVAGMFSWVENGKIEIQHNLLHRCQLGFYLTLKPHSITPSAIIQQGRNSFFRWLVLLDRYVETVCNILCITLYYSSSICGLSN